MPGSRLTKFLRYQFPLALSAGFGIWLFGIFVKFPQGLLATGHFPRLNDYFKLCADPFARDVNPILPIASVCQSLHRLFSSRP